jgi:hypothetical protein
MSDLPEAYDSKAQLKHLDINVRNLVEQQYDFCLYKCTEKARPELMDCK